jgi:hypothetical protein
LWWAFGLGFEPVVVLGVFHELGLNVDDDPLVVIRVKDGGLGPWVAKVADNESA